MASQSSADYRLGQDLGIAVQRLSKRRPSLILNVISDLMDADRSLQAPLRELAYTQAFIKANPLQNRALSSALVSSLLMELAVIYREETLHRVHCVLAGYFRLPEPRLAPSTEPGTEPSTKPCTREDTRTTQASSTAQAPPRTAHRPSSRSGTIPPGEGTGQAGSETNPIDSGLQRLRQLIQTQQWQEADQATWDLLAGSLGDNPDGVIPRQAWSAIPCTLLYELNQVWALHSSHRFGFATQRALWEESSRIHTKLSQNETPQPGIIIKPQSQVFSEFLSDEAVTPIFGISAREQKDPHPSDRPPGYFPRGGKDWTWGGRKGWVVDYHGNHLITEFQSLYERLRDCGITASPLDSASKQKLAALFITYDPTQATSHSDTSADETKPPPSSRSSSAQANDSSQHDSTTDGHHSARSAQADPTGSNGAADTDCRSGTPTNPSNNGKLAITIGVLYLILGLGLWGATDAGTRQTCSTSPWVTRPICLLMESNSTADP